VVSGSQARYRFFGDRFQFLSPETSDLPAMESIPPLLREGVLELQIVRDPTGSWITDSVSESGLFRLEELSPAGIREAVHRMKSGVFPEPTERSRTSASQGVRGDIERILARFNPVEIVDARPADYAPEAETLLDSFRRSPDELEETIRSEFFFWRPSGQDPDWAAIAGEIRQAART
jgi:hypothetical protein